MTPLVLLRHSLFVKFEGDSQKNFNREHMREGKGECYNLRFPASQREKLVRDCNITE